MQSPSNTACGAKTPAGPCATGPEPGKRRCRLHGGAPGSGAPKGNQNAFKHGLFTREELAWLKTVRDFLRHAGATRMQSGDRP
jgi:hypothetical protein